jgi:ABC-2 type transport system ATP-binding protein
MRVVEYLRFRAELKLVARAARAGYVDDAMSKAGVLDVASMRIGHLSKGYRQRVGLADALVARPPLVILDEPTAGLDPNQIRETRDLVRDLGKEHTVVLSTHILSEVEACATRVVVIHEGRLVAEGPTDRVRALGGGSPVVEITFRGEPAKAEAALGAVEGVASVSLLPEADGETRSRIELGAALGPDGANAAVERCVAALVQAGAGVRQITRDGGSLEQVFARLTVEGQRQRRATRTGGS